MAAPERFRAIREMALAQHNLATRAQLRGLGVPATTITDKARSDVGERLAPGVFDVGGGAPPPHRELMAAVLRTGGVAFARSAAALWDLVASPALPEVAVRLDQRPRRVKARVRRLDLAPAELARRLGIPTVTLERAVVHLADEDVLDAALRRGLTTCPRLVAAIDALAGRPGASRTARMLQARAGERGRSESFAEDRLARILRSVPGLDWERQHVVRDGPGFVARLDFACVPARLAVEVDGYGPHSGRRSFQADRTRRTRLAALGWVVLVFTYDDVMRRPHWVRRQILAALAARASRSHGNADGV